MTPSKYYKCFEHVIGSDVQTELQVTDICHLFEPDEKTELAAVYWFIINQFKLHNAERVHEVLNFIFGNVWDLVMDTQPQANKLECVIDTFVKLVKVSAYYLFKINQARPGFVNENTIVYSLLFSVILAAKIIDDFAGNSTLLFFDEYLYISGYTLWTEEEYTDLQRKGKLPEQSRHVAFYGKGKNSEKFGNFVIRKLGKMESYLVSDVLQFHLGIVKEDFETLF